MLSSRQAGVNPNKRRLLRWMADNQMRADQRGKRRTVISIGQLGSERTCSTKKENVMASPTTLRTPYDLRVDLVKDTITTHSKIGDKAAGELAVQVLHALNSIPEKIR
jgi:Family of unknown function (DUF6307)